MSTGEKLSAAESFWYMALGEIKSGDGEMRTDDGLRGNKLIHVNSGGGPSVFECLCMMFTSCCKSRGTNGYWTVHEVTHTCIFKWDFSQNYFTFCCA